MHATQLCITVVGNDVESIRRARIAAEVDADLVELRLDSMAVPDPEGALAGREESRENPRRISANFPSRPIAVAR